MSRRSKRTSLDVILGDAPVEPGTPEAPAPAIREKAPKRQIKQQTLYLPLPVYEQLRRLAFEERVKMHALVMEGLDRVFRDRGLEGLDELQRPDQAS